MWFVKGQEIIKIRVDDSRSCRMKGQVAFCLGGWHYAREVGVDVFHTRAEAEEALRARKTNDGEE
ncbi:MAG: hypothetical protein AMJ46_12555 [Latescibacteria bacterium DG_63]|nr:MAG: hypothetical protein AMJ46_12555 [Latescibacteria bacterium DG_63]